MREIDAVIESYEQARVRGEKADLRGFLPPQTDPHYMEIACELIRVDMEYSFAQGVPKALDDYRSLCADLFDDRRWLSQAAFEEYRLRQGAGHGVAPGDYHRRYGIATSDWPIWHDGTETPSSEWRPKSPAPDCRPSAVDCERQEALLRDAGEFPPCPGDFLSFRLIKEIGRGTFARVYLARQTDLSGRFVTLKITRRLTLEPDRLAQLQHTNIVPVFSVHRVGSLQAICMPYFGARTLADLLRSVRARNGLPQSGAALSETWRAFASQTAEAPFPGGGAPACEEATADTRASGSDRSDAAGFEKTRKPTRVARSMSRGQDPARNLSDTWFARFRQLDYSDAIASIIRDIGAGLTHAHGRGLVHCDLKPANVLLADDGRLMILDFNLAAGQSETGMKNVGGTLPYMAPEHLSALQSGGRVNTTSDIYSLGVIFFELLTGGLPFPVRKGAVDDQIAHMIDDRNQGPPSVRDANRAVSPAVESIVKKCLQPNPIQRYQRVDDLLEDLQCHLEDRPCVHAPNQSLTERAQKWARRHPRLTSTASVALVASLIISVLATLWMLRGRQVDRLHAREAVATLGREMPTLRMALTAPHMDHDEWEKSVNAARASLENFQVDLSATVDSPMSPLRFKNLSGTDRQRLKRYLRELLYLISGVPLREGSGAAGREKSNKALLNEGLHAIRLTRAMSETGSMPRAFLLREAELAAALGQSDRARAAREKARARRTGHSPEDRFLEALDHMSHRRYAEALPALQDATRERPHDVSAWFLLGNCLVGKGRYYEAEGCYTTCIAFQHDLYWPLLHRGLVRLELRKFHEAEADFDRVLHLRPQLVAALINRALARAGHDDLEGAIRDMSSAIDCGGPARAYFLRARFCRRLGRVEQAERDVRIGLMKTPSDEKSWIARGIARLKHDPVKAMDDFQRALVINPASLPALQNIAAVLSRDATKAEETLSIFDQMIALRPDYAPAVAGRGVVLARMGERGQAHRQADRAVGLRDDAKTLYQAACIYALTSRRHADDKQKACRMLARALRKDPRWVKLARTDPDLKAVRNDPECLRLMRAADTLMASE